MSDEQLELSFKGSPFALRLPVDEGMSFFRTNYWDALPKGKATGKCCNRIVHFFGLAGVRYVDEISKVHVVDLQKWLAAKNLKPATINTHHGILTVWINKLGEWQEVGVYAGLDFRPIILPKKNPGCLVKRYKEPPGGVAWAKSVVYKFIETAVYMGDLDMAEDLEMLYLTPLHQIDLFNMTSANVNLGHMTLSGIQHKSICSKNPSGLPYFLAISPRMETILRRRLARTPMGQPLFRSLKVSVCTWRQRHYLRFRAIAAYLKMWHVQIRHFRHSSTTLLLDNNVDSETVRERGGWTTERQLKVYGERKIVHQRHAQAVVEDKDTEILR